MTFYDTLISFLNSERYYQFMRLCSYYWKKIFLKQILVFGAISMFLYIFSLSLLFYVGAFLGTFCLFSTLYYRFGKDEGISFEE